MKAKILSFGLMRLLLILLLAPAPFVETGCGYLAAGAAGGVIGHEISQQQDDDDDDDKN